MLIYRYATGTFSRRKIERATDDSLAFRYMACNRHPDHDTLATFRTCFGKAFESAFVQVLQVARENPRARFGTISLDGTRIHANARRHSALSYGHGEKIEAHLKAEVQERLALADADDQTTAPDGMSLPEEMTRREDRLAAMAAAKVKIEARAKERFEGEQADYEAKMAARTTKEAATGNKPRGKGPKPPEAGPRATDQINLTDEESRIMKVAGGGFEQCYNAQAVVDTESMLILATDVTQACNDKEQVEPRVAKVQANPEGLNPPDTWLADTGYFSAKNVDVCLAAKIDPLIAVKRDEHHPDWRDRFTEPPPLADDASPVAIMKHKLKTQTGRAA